MNSLATIEEIVEIFPHPDPTVEKLEIARVLNFTCVVSKGSYQVGERVILIQPDSVLPDKPWTEPYKKFSKSRTRAIKIRGFISFGIIEKLDLLDTLGEPEYQYSIGTDVTELLGITKYNPPAPQDLQAKGNLPFSICKTDESNWEGIRNLNNYLGKTIDVALKVDGQSCSFYYKDGQFGVLGRTLEYKPDTENKYTSHISRYDLYNKLSLYCDTHKVNLVLRGESYGQGIQNLKNNPHSKLPLNIAFYSVWLIDEMRYAGKGEKHYFVNVCKELDLPTVDILEEDVILTKELIEKYDRGIDKVNDQPFEGVVIKGTDFSFKVINKQYDSKK